MRNCPRCRRANLPHGFEATGVSDVIEPATLDKIDVALRAHAWPVTLYYECAECKSTYRADWGSAFDEPDVVPLDESGRVLWVGKVGDFGMERVQSDSPPRWEGAAPTQHWVMDEAKDRFVRLCGELGHGERAELWEQALGFDDAERLEWRRHFGRRVQDY